MRPVSRFPFSLYKKPSSSGPDVRHARLGMSEAVAAPWPARPSSGEARGGMGTLG